MEPIIESDKEKKAYKNSWHCNWRNNIPQQKDCPIPSMLIINLPILINNWELWNGILEYNRIIRLL